MTREAGGRRKEEAEMSKKNKNPTQRMWGKMEFLKRASKRATSDLIASRAKEHFFHPCPYPHQKFRKINKLNKQLNNKSNKQLN